MISRRTAAAFVVLLVAFSATLFLQVQVASAMSGFANSMCKPFYKQCKCGMEPNPEHEEDSTKPPCIKGKNTNGCDVGVCWEDPAGVGEIKGVCVAENVCQAKQCDGTNCTQAKPGGTGTTPGTAPSGSGSETTPSTGTGGGGQTPTPNLPSGGGGGGSGGGGSTPKPNETPKPDDEEQAGSLWQRAVKENTTPAETPEQKSFLDQVSSFFSPDSPAGGSPDTEAQMQDPDHQFLQTQTFGGADQPQTNVTEPVPEEKSFWQRTKDYWSEEYDKSFFKSAVVEPVKEFFKQDVPEFTDGTAEYFKEQAAQVTPEKPPVDIADITHTPEEIQDAKDLADVAIEKDRATKAENDAWYESWAKQNELAVKDLELAVAKEDLVKARTADDAACGANCKIVEQPTPECNEENGCVNRVKEFSTKAAYDAYIKGGTGEKLEKAGEAYNKARDGFIGAAEAHNEAVGNYSEAVKELHEAKLDYYQTREENGFYDFKRGDKELTIEADSPEEAKKILKAYDDSGKKIAEFEKEIAYAKEKYESRRSTKFDYDETVRAMQTRIDQIKEGRSMIERGDYSRIDEVRQTIEDKKDASILQAARAYADDPSNKADWKEVAKDWNDGRYIDAAADTIKNSWKTVAGGASGALATAGGVPENPYDAAFCQLCSTSERIVAVGETALNASIAKDLAVMAVKGGAGVLGETFTSAALGKDAYWASTGLGVPEAAPAFYQRMVMSDWAAAEGVAIREGATLAETTAVEGASIGVATVAEQKSAITAYANERAAYNATLDNLNAGREIGDPIRVVPPPATLVEAQANLDRLGVENLGNNTYRITGTGEEIALGGRATAEVSAGSDVARAAISEENAKILNSISAESRTSAESAVKDYEAIMAERKAAEGKTLSAPERASLENRYSTSLERLENNGLKPAKEGTGLEAMTAEERVAAREARDAAATRPADPVHDAARDVGVNAVKTLDRSVPNTLSERLQIAAEDASQALSSARKSVGDTLSGIWTNKGRALVEGLGVLNPAAEYVGARAGLTDVAGVTQQAGTQTGIKSYSSASWVTSVEGVAARLEAGTVDSSLIPSYIAAGNPFAESLQAFARSGGSFATYSGNDDVGVQNPSTGALDDLVAVRREGLGGESYIPNSAPILVEGSVAPGGGVTTVTPAAPTTVTPSGIQPTVTAAPSNVVSTNAAPSNPVSPVNVAPSQTGSAPSVAPSVTTNVAPVTPAAPTVSPAAPTPTFADGLRKLADTFNPISSAQAGVSISAGPLKMGIQAQHVGDSLEGVQKALQGFENLVNNVPKAPDFSKMSIGDALAARLEYANTIKKYGSDAVGSEDGKAIAGALSDFDKMVTAFDAVSKNSAVSDGLRTRAGKIAADAAKFKTDLPKLMLRPGDAPQAVTEGKRIVSDVQKALADLKAETSAIGQKLAEGTFPASGPVAVKPASATVPVEGAKPVTAVATNPTFIASLDAIRNLSVTFGMSAGARTNLTYPTQFRAFQDEVTVNYNLARTGLSAADRAALEQAAARLRAGLSDVDKARTANGPGGIHDAIENALKPALNAYLNIASKANVPIDPASIPTPAEASAIKKYVDATNGDFADKFSRNDFRNDPNRPAAKALQDAFDSLRKSGLNAYTRFGLQGESLIDVYRASDGSIVSSFVADKGTPVQTGAFKQVPTSPGVVKKNAFGNQQYYIDATDALSAPSVATVPRAATDAKPPITAEQIVEALKPKPAAVQTPADESTNPVRTRCGAGTRCLGGVVSTKEIPPTVPAAKPIVEAAPTVAPAAPAAPAAAPAAPAPVAPAAAPAAPASVVATPGQVARVGLNKLNAADAAANKLINGTGPLTPGHLKRLDNGTKEILEAAKSLNTPEAQALKAQINKALADARASGVEDTMDISSFRGFLRGELDKVSNPARELAKLVIAANPSAAPTAARPTVAQTLGTQPVVPKISSTIAPGKQAGIISNITNPDTATVVYGFYGIGGAIDTTGLSYAQQFLAAKTNGVLIIPDIGTAPGRMGGGTAGALGTADGAKAFDAEMTAAISSATGISADKVAAMKRAVVFHSGGFSPSNAMLLGLGSKVSAVQSLDGMYPGAPEVLLSWMKSNPNATLTALCSSTCESTMKLSNALSNAGITVNNNVNAISKGVTIGRAGAGHSALVAFNNPVQNFLGATASRAEGTVLAAAGKVAPTVTLAAIPPTAPAALAKAIAGFKPVTDSAVASAPASVPSSINTEQKSAIENLFGAMKNIGVSNAAADLTAAQQKLKDAGITMKDSGNPSDPGRFASLNVGDKEVARIYPTTGANQQARLVYATEAAAPAAPTAPTAAPTVLAPGERIVNVKLPGNTLASYIAQKGMTQDTFERIALEQAWLAKYVGNGAFPADAGVGHYLAKLSDTAAAPRPVSAMEAVKTIKVDLDKAFGCSGRACELKAIAYGKNSTIPELYSSLFNSKLGLGSASNPNGKVMASIMKATIGAFLVDPVAFKGIYINSAERNHSGVGSRRHNSQDEDGASRAFDFQGFSSQEQKTRFLALIAAFLQEDGFQMNLGVGGDVTHADADGKSVSPSGGNTWCYSGCVGVTGQLADLRNLIGAAKPISPEFLQKVSGDSTVTPAKTYDIYKDGVLVKRGVSLPDNVLQLSGLQSLAANLNAHPELSKLLGAGEKFVVSNDKILIQKTDGSVTQALSSLGRDYLGEALRSKGLPFIKDGRGGYTVDGVGTNLRMVKPILSNAVFGLGNKLDAATAAQLPARIAEAQGKFRFTKDTDKALVFGILAQETRGLTNERSPANAYGIGQTTMVAARDLFESGTPSWIRDYFVKTYGSPERLMSRIVAGDVQASVDATVGELSNLRYRYGLNDTGVIAAYNGGPTRGRNYVNGSGFIPAETADYVPKVQRWASHVTNGQIPGNQTSSSAWAAVMHSMRNGGMTTAPALMGGGGGSGGSGGGGGGGSGGDGGGKELLPGNVGGPGGQPFDPSAQYAIVDTNGKVLAYVAGGTIGSAGLLILSTGPDGEPDGKIQETVSDKAPSDAREVVLAEKPDGTLHEDSNGKVAAMDPKEIPKGTWDPEKKTYTIDTNPPAPSVRDPWTPGGQADPYGRGRYLGDGYERMAGMPKGPTPTGGGSTGGGAPTGGTNARTNPPRQTPSYPTPIPTPLPVPPVTPALTAELSCSPEQAVIGIETKIQIRWSCVTGTAQAQGFSTGGRAIGTTEIVIPRTATSSANFRVRCVLNQNSGDIAQCTIPLVPNTDESKDIEPPATSTQERSDQPAGRSQEISETPETTTNIEYNPPAESEESVAEPLPEQPQRQLEIPLPNANVEDEPRPNQVSPQPNQPTAVQRLGAMLTSLKNGLLSLLSGLAPKK